MTRYLLDGSLVNTTALVDKMAGGGGLSRVDVADDDAIHRQLRTWNNDAATATERKAREKETETYTFTCVFSLPIVVEYAGDYADG